MRKDIHFWIAMLVRGVLALLAGSAVLIIPDMAKTLLLLPFAVGISILLLGAYGVVDSGMLFVASFMAETKTAAVTMRLQGVVGATVGILLVTLVYDHVGLYWFLYLVGAQALSVAVAEFVVARHATGRTTRAWDYAAAAIALVCGVAYLTVAVNHGADLVPRDIAVLVFGYLLAFGMALCLTAARMLYTDRAQ